MNVTHEKSNYYSYVFNLKFKIRLITAGHNITYYQEHASCGILLVKPILS